MERMLVALCILFTSTAWAGPFMGSLDGLENVAGTVSRTGRNTIEITDDRDHSIVRLVYLDQNGVLHKGDRVRAWYRLRDNFAEVVKKMRPNGP